MVGCRRRLLPPGPAGRLPLLPEIRVVEEGQGDLARKGHIDLRQLRAVLIRDGEASDRLRLAEVGREEHVPGQLQDPDDALLVRLEPQGQALRLTAPLRAGGETAGQRPEPCFHIHGSRASFL